MTTKTMSVEQMIHKLECAQVWCDNDTYTRLKEVIDAMYETKNNPVGYLHIQRFRGSQEMINTNFDYALDLPDGDYTLYTAPPELLPQPAIPSGWKLVPVTATDYQIKFGVDKYDQIFFKDTSSKAELIDCIYQAMLDAAPQSESK